MASKKAIPEPAARTRRTLTRPSTLQITTGGIAGRVRARSQANGNTTAASSRVLDIDGTTQHLRRSSRIAKRTALMHLSQGMFRSCDMPVPSIEDTSGQRRRARASPRVSPGRRATLAPFGDHAGEHMLQAPSPIRAAEYDAVPGIRRLLAIDAYVPRRALAAIFPPIVARSRHLLVGAWAFLPVFFPVPRLGRRRRRRRSPRPYGPRRRSTPPAVRTTNHFEVPEASSTESSARDDAAKEIEPTPYPPPRRRVRFATPPPRSPKCATVEYADENEEEDGEDDSSEILRQWEREMDVEDAAVQVSAESAMNYRRKGWSPKK